MKAVDSRSGPVGGTGIGAAGGSSLTGGIGVAGGGGVAGPPIGVARRRFIQA